MEENQNKISYEHFISVCSNILNCKTLNQIRINIGKIINIKHPACQYKIGRTDNPSERLSTYPNDIIIMYPIVFCNDINIIKNIEETFIRYYKKEHPHRCKNEQDGGGPYSDSPHQFVYIVIFQRH